MANPDSLGGVEPRFLPIAVRAWTEPEVEAGSRKGRRGVSWRPREVVVFDTETTVDAPQRLTFGSWRYYRVSWPDGRPVLSCVEEGLFYDDDLGTWYPDGLDVLRAYQAGRRADVDPAVPDAAWQLRLYPRSRFVEQIIYRTCYQERAWLVGFNLPFDLSRIAVNAGDTRNRRPDRFDPFEGGFTLRLFSYQKEGVDREASLFRPRIAVKTIDSKRHLIGFRQASNVEAVDRIPDDTDDHQPDPKWVFRGHFLDLRTLAFALTDESHSLASACETFHVEHPKLAAAEHGRITPEYVDYNRRDVQASGELLAALLAEYVRHDIDLSPTRAYSPASLGKAYLRRMGVRPILRRHKDFPRDVLGYAMAAYYGGRAECRIRRTPVPVVYCDFLSMYPTVNTLMGLWQHLTRGVRVREDTEAVRAFVERITPEDCFRPDTWRRLPALVQVEPEGDVLPVRADYDAPRHWQPNRRGHWQIGINPLTAETPLWYGLPDVVAAKLLTGRTPRIRRALRLEPGDGADKLRPVRLLGEVDINPGDDLFQAIIERRKALPKGERPWLNLGLKVLANATSYGIFAEIVRHELNPGHHRDVTLWGVDGQLADPVPVSAVEEAGEYSFPPLAACITSAARLMLALAEAAVTEQGGYAFCDTDSIAVVATKDGGLIPCPGGSHRTPDGAEAIAALTWSQVDEIRTRFNRLHPYDRVAVRDDLLQLEDENLDPTTGRRQQLWFYGISAKRYCLYNLGPDGRPIIRKPSQHGLGHLLNPTDPDSEDDDWITAIWQHLLAVEAGQGDEPGWFDRPAIGRTTVTTPAMRKPFIAWNQGKPYGEQVKPFNFMLTAHLQPFGVPVGADPQHFQLVAPWNPNPRQWLDMEWVDRYSGSPYRVTTEGDVGQDGLALINSYRTTASSYRTHPELKSAAPDGRTGTRATRGLLRRQPVQAISITYLGKESNRLEDVEAGIIHDPDETLTEYAATGPDVWDTIVIPAIEVLGDRAVADEAGVNRQDIWAYRTRRRRPRLERQAGIIAAVARLGRNELAKARRNTSPDDMGTLRIYLAECPGVSQGDQDRE